MAQVSQRLALVICALLGFAAKTARADAPIAPLDFTPPPFDNAGAIDNAGTKNATLTNEPGAVVVNERGATWNGDVTANGGQIGNQGTWNGSLANTSGAFANDGQVNGGVNNAAQFVNNTSGVVSGQLANSGAATNNGLIASGVVNSGAFVNNTSGSVAFIANTGGTSTNDGAAGMLEALGGAIVNAGSAGGATVSSSGTLRNSGEIAGDVTAQGALGNAGVIDGGVSGLGSFTNDGVVKGAVTDGDLVNNTDGALQGGFASDKGVAVNNGVIAGGVDLSGMASLTNNGAIQGDVTSYTIAGSLVNNGRIAGDVQNGGGMSAGPFINNSQGEITGNVTNVAAQSASNFGVIDGEVNNAGAFLNASSGVIAGGLANLSGRTQNDGVIDAGANVAGGELANNGLIAGAVGVAATASLVNNARLTGSLTNAGAFTNNATGALLGSLANSGTTMNSGLVVGAATNSGAFLNAATGALQGGLVQTGGHFVNHGVIAGGAAINSGDVVSDGTISGGVAIGPGGTLDATGSLSGAVQNAGVLAVADASGAPERKLTLTPGSSLVGVVDVPVNLSTGQANELLARGANVSSASVTLTGALSNPARAYWGALAFADTPIALSPQSAAAVSALSDGLYAYSISGGAIAQTVNPGLAGAAPYPVMAMLTTFNTAFFADPAEIARSAGNASERGLGLSLWTRASASQLEISGQSSAGAGPSFNAARYATRIDGDQFGADMGLGRLGAGDLAFHAGLTGGVAQAAAADDLTSGVSAKAGAVFGGAYATLENDSLFLGVSARYQRFDLSLNDAPLALSGVSAQASGLSYMAQAGFRVFFADVVFVEPSAAAIVTHMAVNGQTTNAGALSYAPLVSELGRLGLRIGTGLQSGAFRVEPYLAAQFWREFAGETTTYVQNGPTIVGASAGAFSRVAFGLNASPAPNGFAIFAEGAWTTGANVKGWGLNGGMRARF